MFQNLFSIHLNGQLLMTINNNRNHKYYNIVFSNILILNCYLSIPYNTHLHMDSIQKINSFKIFQPCRLNYAQTLFV